MPDFEAEVIWKQKSINNLYAIINKITVKPYQ